MEININESNFNEGFNLGSQISKNFQNDSQTNFQNRNEAQNLNLKENKTQNQFNDETPKVKRASSIPQIEVKVLPSNFISYPPDAKIYYYPYTFGEITTLSQMSKIFMENPKELIKFSLKGIKANFDKTLITYYDFLYINHLRRISSFEEPRAVFETVCPKCGKPVKKTLSFFDLPFVDVEVPQLPIKATINNVELHFSFLNLRDFLKIDLKIGTGIEALASCVRNLPLKKAYEVLKTASGEDLRVLDYIDKLLYHGLKPIPVVCQNKVNTYASLIKFDNEDDFELDEEICGYEFNMEAEDPTVLIYPFRESTNSIRDRISFG